MLAIRPISSSSRPPSTPSAPHIDYGRKHKALLLAPAFRALGLAAEALGASAVALHLPDEGHDVPNRFTEGFDEAGPELFRARYGVLPERPGDTHIELGWSDGRTSVDRDAEIAIELLCDHLSIALERLESGGEPSILAKVVNLRG